MRFLFNHDEQYAVSLDEPGTARSDSASKNRIGGHHLTDFVEKARGIQKCPRNLETSSKKERFL